MSNNYESSSRAFGDSLQLTNWILDSVTISHTTLHISHFIPGLLEDTDIYIEVEDRHHVTAKPKGQVQIKYSTITEILL